MKKLNGTKCHRCHQENVQECAACSLASYGRDCENVVINPTCINCGAELDRTFYRDQAGQLMVRIPDICFMGSCL